ncbi:GNAT family N-acetyltransferase [Cellvibrio mixtus]|uniref:GNAT family N-acetyltransferase n=1 Tax=Cellvibrio mixtus TaxID=39650 RepID=UPI0006941C1C|nr:GNAT family N-acetyltransferase [Cellvibrio mixtus]
MSIRPCATHHIPAICDIYNHYIANTLITFEETPVSVADMQKRIEKNTQLFPWLVYEENEKVIGYAYASTWKDRSAYKYTAEVTVYLHPEHCGKGIGSALYKELIEQLAKNGIHILLACITIPNLASEKIHTQFGFRQVAHFREVGFKFGHWVDVGYWQKTL